MDVLKNNTMNQTSSLSTNRKSHTPPVNPLASSDKISTEGLKTGDTITGQIVNINHDQVTIRVNNNTSFTAKLSPGTEHSLNIGMDATFSVESVSPTELYLKVQTNAYPYSQDITIDKALEEAGLPKNLKNMEIVRELLNHNLSISKQSITGLLNQSFKYHDVSVAALILMNKHNIPIDSQNTAQFQAYLNQEHEILKAIEHLTEELPELLSHFEQDTDRLLQINDTLAALAAPNSLTHTEPPSLSMDKIMEVLQVLKDSNMLSPELESAILNQKADGSQLASLLKDISMNLNHPIINDLLAQLSPVEPVHDDLKSLLTEAQREQLADLIKGMPLNEEQLASIKSGNYDIDECLQFIQKNLNTLTEQDIRSLIVNKEYQSMLSNRMTKNCSISPAQMQEENGVKQLFQRLNRQIYESEQLLGMLNEIHPDKSNQSLSYTAGNLKDNLNFMNSLNQMFTYMQLPVKLREQIVNSELYVYTKKKDLKAGSNSITVLLHLDMEHLKSLDVHISLIHNQVNTKFYMEDEDAKEIITDYMYQLEDRLKQKGYAFHSEAMVRERELDIVTDLIEKDNPAAPIKRYTFDIRA